MHDLDHGEGVAGGDGVDQQVAMNADGVLSIDGGKFVLLVMDGGEDTAFRN